MKINLTTLGCAKNLVDSEILLGGLKGEGVEIVQDAAQAETIILNTCGFIQGAKEESIDAILAATELKKNGNCKNLFVTGCLSQRYRDELSIEIPEVDGFFGNSDMIRILRDMLTRLDLKRELLGERHLTTPRHFAYLKISEGCENPCTFCSIPGIRGPFKSRDSDSLLQEAQRLADFGVQELILIAQDSTIYGVDRYDKRMLVPLLERLVALDAFPWIRLLYTYPSHFDDELLEIIVKLGQVINYVDMPIQHINDLMLRRMARKVTRARIEEIIERLRTGNPEIALRTSLITGFPGETEVQFQELADFVAGGFFERVGLFTYSQEEGTPACAYTDQVPDFVKQERWAELCDIQSEVSLQRNRRQVGAKIPVLVDDWDVERHRFVGRTSADCPEVDNCVLITPHPAITRENFVQLQLKGALIMNYTVPMYLDSQIRDQHVRIEERKR